MKNIKERMQNVFRDFFDDDRLVIFDEMTAQDVEGWDSLTHVSLVLDIEKEFGIEFTTEEITRVENVGAFIRLVESKLQ